jgi:hypothetical protein
MSERAAEVVMSPPSLSTGSSPGINPERTSQRYSRRWPAYCAR